MQDVSLYGISSSLLLKQARSFVYCEEVAGMGVSCGGSWCGEIEGRTLCLCCLFSSFFPLDEAGVGGV